MGDETPVKQKRNRKPNPLSTFKKAKQLADRARKAHARAEELAAKAKAAADAAAALAAQKETAEAAEQEALAALRAEIEGTDVDSDDDVSE